MYRLVEAGDWEGVVLAAAQFEGESDADDGTCDQVEVYFDAEQELCIWDSEDEITLSFESLETPMFNLLLNIYNQESG